MKTVNKILIICFVVFMPVILIAALRISFSSKSEVSLKNNYYTSEEFLNLHFYEHYLSEQEMSQSEYEFWDKTVISLITISKGDSVYQWFGHSAISVQLPSEQSVIYNYGYFSFSDGFYTNFAMGRLIYCCGATYTRYEVANANYEGRTVSQIELNLSPGMKRAVVNYLELNTAPSYNEYLYHYYYDNCATRIRDIINYSTEGKFRQWAEQFPTGGSADGESLTFRMHNSRIMAQNCFVLWVLDFLQGTSIDNKNPNLWDEMFLPAVLEKAVSEYDGLAGENTYLTDFRETDTRFKDLDKNFYYYIQCFLIFSFIGVLMVFLSYKKRGLYNVLTFIVLFVFALLSVLLFFMVFFTDHDVVWGNENAVFFNPLLLVTSFLTLKSKKHEKGLFVLWLFHLFSVILIILLKLLLPGIFYQQNTAQILTFLPLCLANLFVFRKAFKQK